MKLIIDILEEEYKMLVNPHQFLFNEHTFDNLRESIKNGIPLPKGHGDLIDRSKLLVELECGIRAGNYEEGYEKYSHINDMDDCFDTVKYADTIIEADKGE